MRKIKMIWDFRGPDGIEIAKHHQKHLDEYVAIEKIEATSGYNAVNEVFAIAYLIIKEENMIQVRDALKPHRAEVAD
jgi:hypothetical protein